MARIARIVVPGLPHHVTQRGNRKQPIFLRDGDERAYLRMLSEQAHANGVEVWAYCLMPNHVHLILVPQTEDGLARAIGQTHREYTSFINSRESWTGHLFQSRFASVVMDEEHLWNGVLYVSLNPVRARLCSRAQDWPWSSVHAHVAAKDDGLVRVAPIAERFGDFASVLRQAETGIYRLDTAFDALRKSETTGRPLGSKAFVAELEKRTGRTLAPKPRGPRPA